MYICVGRYYLLGSAWKQSTEGYLSTTESSTKPPNWVCVIHNVYPWRKWVHITQWALELIDQSINWWWLLCPSDITMATVDSVAAPFECAHWHVLVRSNDSIVASLHTFFTIQPPLYVWYISQLQLVNCPGGLRQAQLMCLLQFDSCLIQHWLVSGTKHAHFMSFCIKQANEYSTVQIDAINCTLDKLRSHRGAGKRVNAMQWILAQGVQANPITDIGNSINVCSVSFARSSFSKYT